MRSHRRRAPALASSSRARSAPVVVASLFVLTMMVGSYRDRRRGTCWPPRCISATIPAIDFIVRELRLPTALTGLVGRAGARRLAGSCSRSCSPTRSPRPTSSASRRARACSPSASIILFDVGSVGVSMAALVGALVSCGARLRARLARRHLRLPLHPDRDRRLGAHVLDRRLPDRQGRHLRRARGDDVARRVGRAGRDRASSSRSWSPWPCSCPSRCCWNGRCACSSWATTLRRRSAPRGGRPPRR